MAIFRHVVNCNGVYYPAGADVPIEAEVNKKTSALLDDEEETPKKKPGRPPKKKE